MIYFFSKIARALIDKTPINGPLTSLSVIIQQIEDHRQAERTMSFIEYETWRIGRGSEESLWLRF